MSSRVWQEKGKEKEKEHFQTTVQRWRTRVYEEKAIPYHSTKATNPSSKATTVLRRRRRSDPSVCQDYVSDTNVASSSLSDPLGTREPCLKRQKLTEDIRRPRSTSPSFLNPLLSSDSISPEFLSPSPPSSIATMSTSQASPVSQPTPGSVPVNMSSSPPKSGVHSAPADLPLHATRRKMNEELDGRVVCPMHPSHFLNDLLPKPPNMSWKYKKEMQDATQAIIALQGVKPESALYQPLATAFSTLSDNQLYFSVSAQQTDPFSDLKLRPDLMAYSSPPPQDRWTDWSSTELWVEVKLEASHDGFPPPDPDSSFTINQQATRSQIIHYMDTHWKSQRREHGFCIEFLGNTSQIRLLRYDPAGIISTAALDLEVEDDAKLFSKFLARFGATSRERRGWCTRWTKADGSEQDLASVAQFLGCVTTDLFKIEIDSKIYFTGRHKSRRFFRSRATIGYNAARRNDNNDGFEKIFIKEAWAYEIEVPPSLEGAPLGYREHEGEIYRKLNSAGVLNIPNLETDIELSKTVTGNYQDVEGLTDSTPRKVLEQTHRIFVFRGWAKQLEEAATIREMLGAWRDAIHSFKAAIKKTGQLHRDVSNGNVLIAEGGRGQLADWDQSIEMSAAMAVSDGRTGTPIFMATELLFNRGMRHQPIHDIESFYHLLVWLAYFYTPCPLPSTRINALVILFTLPEDVHDHDPLETLGDHKVSEVLGRRVSDDRLKQEDFAPLGSLLVDLRKEVIRPVFDKKPNFTWEMAADKSIALAEAVIAGNHSKLDEPLRGVKGIRFPWVNSSSVTNRSSQSGSKRSRGSQGGRARKIPRTSAPYGNTAISEDEDEDEDEDEGEDEGEEGDKTIDAGGGSAGGKDIQTEYAEEE